MRLWSNLFGSSSVFTVGGSCVLFCGINERSFLIVSKHSYSFFAAKCATPLFSAWVIAPPRSSNEISSPRTVFTTSGPVTNIVPAFSTIITKSVIAGEYTAPPADGPMLAVICGTTPEANSLW